MKKNLALPVLYHANPSFFSQIVRLSIVERGISVECREVDIHVQMDQIKPRYRKINPLMTVPALVDNGETIEDSRKILERLEIQKPLGNTSAIDWTSKIYKFPVEALTFGNLLTKAPFIKIILRKKISRMIAYLEKTKDVPPDLSASVDKKITILKGRNTLLRKSEYERARSDLDAIMLLINKNLEKREWFSGDSYGFHDPALTCFIARITMIGLDSNYRSLEKIWKYWDVVKARPSFEVSNIWDRIQPLHIAKEHLGLIGRTSTYL